MAFTSSVRRQSASNVVAIEPARLIPALLTSVVGRPNAPLQRLERRVPVRGDGDVERMETRGRAEAVRSPRARLRVHVGEQDPRALGHEPLGDRLADARRRPGDERDLVLQPRRHGPRVPVLQPLGHQRDRLAEVRTSLGAR